MAWKLWSSGYGREIRVLKVAGSTGLDGHFTH